MWGKSASHEAKGARGPGTPLRDMAPRVPPWYPPQREISSCLPSFPLSRWYWRAIFMADSIASEPPETK